MTLPPIDQTPTVVVRFTKKASERLLHLCEKRFKESGLLVLSRHSCGSNNDKNKSNSSSSSSNDGKIIILLTTTHAVLEAQAERIHLMKRTIDTRVMEYFSSKEKHRFRNVDDIGNLSKLKKNNNNNNSNVPKRHFDREGIFTSRDRAFLTSRLVKQVTVLDDGQERNELSEFLFSEYQASSRLHNVMDASNSRSFSSFVEDDENDDNVVEHGEKSDTLWHVLTSLDLIDVVEAVHQPALRDMVVAETTLAPFWKVQPPVNLIQDYVSRVVCDACIRTRKGLHGLLTNNCFFVFCFASTVWIRSWFLLCLDWFSHTMVLFPGYSWPPRLRFSNL